MRVLVVGSGAREHALAWRLEQDGVEVTVAPGNGGTPRTAFVAANDLEGLSRLAQRERFDLTLVGPEDPLERGIVDLFEELGLNVFGPTQAAARLESSKAWAKQFLQRHGIPTARAEIVDGEVDARAAIARVGLPVAIKADGLAAGKGVFIVHSQQEVEEALTRCLAFGPRMVIEEMLEGPELSVLAFCDGERVAVMPPCRDYKRVHDGDQGPNTGGMGGFSRPSDATPELMEWVEKHVLQTTVRGMARDEGVPYRGVLYAGLMLTRDGPRVLEFNCRFGDPECQLLMPLMSSSLVETCQSVAEGRLQEPRWRDGRTYGVVLAAEGYPTGPVQGAISITGLDQLPPNVQAFHAGTTVYNGKLLTMGGRIITLVSQSREAVYAAAEHVQFRGKHYRRDIGLEAAVASR